MPFYCLIEILFLILGVWLILSGRIPSKFFQRLFGKGNYVLTLRQTRLLGLFLASPIPLTFSIPFILRMISGQSQPEIAGTFVFIYGFVVIVVALVVADRCRKN
jgi:hypothetical protein